MPSKKRKYNQRFPAGRIKKIMQSDEEVGKVAQAVPIIISRTLELFVESLLNKTLRITNARNAKTLSPSHMKQCIMSETRFDFLKELVKNVPDINVDEMQTAADDNTATDLTMPYHKSPVPVSATNCESSVSGTSKSIRSIPPFNGNTSTSTSNRNGNNRRSRPVTPTATSSAKLKPQPLLKTQSMDQSLLTSMSPTSSSYHTPNFYTEISDSSVKSATTVNSVIQFTPKIQNVSNLDVRPPKLNRIDSAPGCLGDIQNAAYRTPLPQPDTPPVMTFDFTKTALPPPPLYTSINVKPPIPPLMPINNQATTSLHSPFLYPSTSSLTPPSPTAALHATPFVKMDACKSSVVKTNNFISSNSTTSSLPSTSKPQAPILNIDLSNSFNISQPMFGSISTSNSLDMDEDYDNI